MDSTPIAALEARARATVRAARGVRACAAEARAQLRRVGALALGDGAIASGGAAAAESGRVREEELEALQAMIKRLGDAAVYYRDRAEARSLGADALAHAAARRIAAVGAGVSTGVMTTPGLDRAAAVAARRAREAALEVERVAALGDSSAAVASANGGVAVGSPSLVSPSTSTADVDELIDASAAADATGADAVADFATLRLLCDDMQHTVSSLGDEDPAYSAGIGNAVDDDLLETATSGLPGTCHEDSLHAGYEEDDPLARIAAIGDHKREQEDFERAVLGGSSAGAMERILDVRASTAAIERQRAAADARRTSNRTRRLREEAEAAEEAAVGVQDMWVSTPTEDSQKSVEKRIRESVALLETQQSAQAQQAQRQHEALQQALEQAEQEQAAQQQKPVPPAPQGEQQGEQGQEALAAIVQPGSAKASIVAPPAPQTATVPPVSPSRPVPPTVMLSPMRSAASPTVSSIAPMSPVSRFDRVVPPRPPQMELMPPQWPWALHGAPPPPPPLPREPPLHQHQSVPVDASLAQQTSFLAPPPPPPIDTQAAAEAVEAAPWFRAPPPPPPPLRAGPVPAAPAFLPPPPPPPPLHAGSIPATHPRRIDF